MEKYRHVIVPLVNSLLKDVFGHLENGMRSATFKLSDACHLLNGVEILIVILVQSLKAKDTGICLIVLKELRLRSDCYGVTEALVHKLWNFFLNDPEVYRTAGEFARSLVSRKIVEVPEDILLLLDTLSGIVQVTPSPPTSVTTLGLRDETVQRYTAPSSSGAPSVPTNVAKGNGAATIRTQSLLVDAIKKKDLSAVRNALAKGAKADVTIKEGVTPLVEAVKSGATVEIVDCLLEAGGNVHEKDSDGLTPLHVAAEKGTTEVVMCLLRAGGDPNVQTRDGRTPLHLAVVRGAMEVVQCLVMAGGAIGTKTNGGSTPLHWAAVHGHQCIAQLLVGRGAEVNSRDSSHHTPLSLAIRWKHYSVAEYLQSVGGVCR